MSVLSATDIAALAGQELDQTSVVSLQTKLDALQEEVENFLHRRLERAERTEVHQATYEGRLNLMGPRAVVTSVQTTDDPPVNADWNYDREYADSISVGWGATPFQSYTVVYTSGDAAPKAVVQLMKDVAVRGLIAGLKVSSGVVAGFSVEGTSIRYGAIADAKTSETAEGSFTAPELKTLSTYRRRVVR